MNRNQSDIAYEFLRSKLISRELSAGSRVRYGPLGDQIGMSATPVREAIGRLASEGLVDLVPQAGAVVKRLSRSDAVEVFEMREAIEPYAAAKAAQLIGLHQLKVLQGTLDQILQLLERSKAKTLNDKHARQFDEADLEFHLTILRSTENRRMLKVVSDYHVLTEIIGVDRHSYSRDVVALTVDDHAAILDGLRRRDGDAAREAMLTHIRNSRQLTLTGMGKG
ncbi:GntR family transcriptional regulator [Rhodopirellula bahusiensis]|uniref:GntR family transcriptional regulator n=1 Tax=Rhodopirellula bahusiensis TaxID=2014065 RepID=A0A2G1WD69_9BACT|nr:GntR family transcriptional regulator [Rhodopirellula bahusiensis]PHQ36995.1 GntR family transcriptional regulator [Rhodopirellula bahusiensis]